MLQGWSCRTGEYSPDYYAYYGPNETSDLIRERLDRFVRTDASVLELGCSAGRHLAHLHDNHYEDLYGIDVNDDALAVMRREYPTVADAGHFYVDAIERVIPTFDDDQFDVVFSVETLQHVHREHTWVFDEIARVAGDVIITVEVESDPDTGPSVTYVNDEFPLYRRNWADIFEGDTFVLRESITLDRTTMRVFRTNTDNGSR